MARLGAPSAQREDLEDLNEHILFADHAYDDQDTIEKLCDETGYHLLYVDTLTKAGERTGHFVAFNKQKKRVVVAIKGTSDINDIITDAVCAAVPLRRKHGLFERPSDALAHEAMSDAAHYLSKTFSH